MLKRMPPALPLVLSLQSAASDDPADGRLAQRLFPSSDVPGLRAGDRLMHGLMHDDDETMKVLRSTHPNP